MFVMSVTRGAPPAMALAALGIASLKSAIMTHVRTAIATVKLATFL